MSGNLNIFQRTMLQWNRLHPYNAIHVLRVRADLDAARLEAVANGLLGELGLTGLVVDKHRRTFRYGGGMRAAVEVREALTDRTAAIEADIQRQLNVPFEVDRPFTPLRFFARGGHGGFDLGLTYCHFISDAVPVVAMLRSLVRSYTGAEASPPRLNLYPDVQRRWEDLLRRRGLYWALDWPRFIQHLTQANKPRYVSRADHTNGFRLFEIASGPLGVLKQAARSWGATLHDVFLAMLAKGVAPLAGQRTGSARRNKAVLSSIVNVRGDLCPGGAHNFGLFLGNFLTFHAVGAGASLRDLTKEASRQTAVIKEHKLYLRTLLDQAITGPIMAWFSADRKQKAYRQHFPVWAGITNLTMNPLMDRTGRERITEYVRAVSTGPVCPLVLSITTFRDSAKVGVSFRNTVFGPQSLQGVLDVLQQCIADPHSA